MFWNVGYFDSMGILAVSCFQRNLISLPLAARRNTICILVRSKLKKQTNKARHKGKDTNKQRNLISFHWLAFARRSNPRNK